MRILILLLALMLSSCVETRYVKIPSELTRHCEVHQPQEISLDGAVDLANARKDSIDECNARMDKIHQVEGSLISLRKTGT